MLMTPEMNATLAQHQKDRNLLNQLSVLLALVEELNSRVIGLDSRLDQIEAKLKLKD